MALLGASPPAFAAPTDRLTYQAPDGCPSEPEFLASVTGRGGDFEASGATGRGPAMVVTIHREGDRFAGTFHLRDERTATAAREVHAPTCAAVADALAVVTAIALHADAHGGATAPPAPVDARWAPEPPAPGPPSPLPDDRLRGSTRVFPPRTESVQVRAGTLRFDLKRSATVYAGAAVGLIPSVVLPRYDLSLLAANFVTAPGGEQRIPGLVLELHFGVLGPGTYASPDTKTDLSGLSFGIDLCQSPHYDTKGLVLLFCGGYGGGLMMLKTRALDGTQLQSKNSGFGEVTLSAEAQYYLGAGFHVGLRVGGGFTVGEITAERADGSRIFRSSPWSAFAMLGAGVRF
jgi:hypothetical protein